MPVFSSEPPPEAVAAVVRGGVPPLQNGHWRALLQRADGIDIVFNFEVKDSAHRKILYIRNAGERLLVDDITMQQDSLLINLPFFESQIRVVFRGGDQLEGVWVKRLTDRYQYLPFRAFHKQAFRFVAGRRPTGNISGRWAVRFTDTLGKVPSFAVGEFVQKGAEVTGTFLTATGDYRFLQGVVDGDSLKLSTFDGGNAYLFTARVGDDSTLAGGQFFSGSVSRRLWGAKRDAKASLPDEFSLAKVKEGAGPLDFSFRDIDGKAVSIHDEAFKGKILLVQIMGSWCPNCMDETAFLSGLYDEYKGKGVEIIGLAYERSEDFVRSQKSLRSFQQRFHVQYPLLITGVSVNDPKRTEKTLPQLDKIAGFPTTLFVDRQGRIQKVHTGFNGPGTGSHYEEQKKEFRELVDGMLTGQ